MMEALEVRAILLAHCQRYGGAKAWAIAKHISAPYVSDVLNGRRMPGKKILNALRLIKVVGYERMKS